MIDLKRYRERCIAKADTWYWRARYWWMDTHEGAQARVALICMALLVIIIEFIRVMVAALLPPPPGEPVKAFYWWVVQLIILVISAAIAYLARPKIEGAKPNDGEGPTCEDGQSVVRFWGTHWISDEYILAYKVVGRDQIKGKGGK